MGWKKIWNEIEKTGYKFRKITVLNRGLEIIKLCSSAK